MTPDEFRVHGAAIIERIARYMEEVEDLPVVSAVEPGWVRSRLPSGPPPTGEAWEQVMADVDEVIVPGLTHWQSPGFFGYFPTNASGPAILGDLLSSGFGVQGMLWATSPACTELEQHVLDWLVDLTGLPDRFRSSGPGGGVIQDTASSASLCAVVAARERAGGMAADLCAYTSEQAHSSIEKAMKIAGFGPGQLRRIPTDPVFAMQPGALGRAMDDDLGAGRRPFFVTATVGTTSSTAVDPVPAIADHAERHGAWLHVDAAYAGSAAVCPGFRFVVAGADRCDSWVFNPHKWLLTNFDCSAFYVADRTALTRALSVVPEYLRNEASESGAVVDFRDWQIPLGRRFRALKLWFVIRHYGAEGLAAHIRHTVGLAQDLAARVEADARLDLAAPSPFALVCLRHVDGDAATQRVIDGVNRSGQAHVTHTRLDERLVMRVAIGAPGSEARHVDVLWSLIDSLAGEKSAG